MINFIRTILIYIRFRIYKNRKFEISLYVTNPETKQLLLYSQFIVYALSRKGAYIKTELENSKEFHHADHISMNEKIF